jgi:hypothetical protein
MNRDQELKRAVHKMFIAVMDNGGGTAEDVADIICELYPNLSATYGKDHIQRLVVLRLHAELPTLSRAYTAVFAHFNSRYFDNRLPQYVISVVYDVDSEDGIGCICANLNLIRLRVTENERWMIANLLCLMAGVAVESDKDQWRKELERLREAEAPVATETEPRTLMVPSETQCAEALAVVGRIIITCDPLEQPTITGPIRPFGGRQI